MRTNSNQRKWYKPLLLSLLLRQNIQKSNVRKKACVVAVGCLLVWAQSFMLQAEKEMDATHHLTFSFVYSQ